jgi:hypothetical protein
MRCLSGILVCWIAILSGCGVAEPPQWKAWRDQFVLKDKPEGAITIAEAIAMSAGNEDEISIVAQIGSGKGDTFDEKNASFLVSEAPDEAHQGKPGHDPDGCPFCKQKLANAPTVTVGFSDSLDKPILVDARRLFGLTKGDIVVVKGRASYEESMKILTINATGLHVVQK